MGVTHRVLRESLCVYSTTKLELTTSSICGIGSLIGWLTAGLPRLLLPISGNISLSHPQIVYLSLYTFSPFTSLPRVSVLSGFYGSSDADTFQESPPQSVNPIRQHVWPARFSSFADAGVDAVPQHGGAAGLPRPVRGPGHRGGAPRPRLGGRTAQRLPPA